MQAFFCPDQLLHTPQQFMRLGRLHKPADVPARAEALRDTLTRLGVPVHLPAEAGLDALQAVHSPAYLAYLAERARRGPVKPGWADRILHTLSPALTTSRAAKH